MATQPRPVTPRQGDENLTPHVSRLPLLVRPVIFALGVVIVIFIVYDFVEGKWLADLDHHRLEVFHQLRGLFSALVAAFIVGWLILRKSQPLLATALSPDEWATGTRPSVQERNAVYARWFVRMRWTAVLVAGILVVLTVFVAELLPRTVLWPLIVTIAVLAVLNAAYTVLIRRGQAVGNLLSFQAYADLLILVVLLHFSGGVENPLAPLMLFHVIIAGIVLSRRECFVVATVAAVLFATLAWIEMVGILPHYTLGIFPHVEQEGHLAHAAHNLLYVASGVLLQGAILILSAFFVTTLADRLRRDERQLQRFADRILTERQLLERALETTGTGLCVCDREMQPLWQNRQWDVWFGEVPAGSLLFNQLHGPDSPARQTSRDRQVRVAEIFAPSEESCPGAHQGSENGTRTFQTTTAPLVDQDDELSQVVQLVQDVSEQKRTQSRMMRAGQLAAVGELAGQVAHEVNNPTAIISAKARLLLANHRNEMSEKTAQELAKITDLADRVARIAQGLLSYCRPSAGTRVPIDIRVPIRKALNMVEERARLSGIGVEDRLSDRPYPVRANAGELEQVFLNLFLNSLDAMPEGGRLSVLNMLTETREDETPHVDVVVEDTGSGIPRTILNRVFEPFFTTKADGNGTGLGLSICLGLIRSHGGTIDLSSEPGVGTRFSVKLPLELLPTDPSPASAALIDEL